MPSASQSALGLLKRLCGKCLLVRRPTRATRANRPLSFGEGWGEVKNCWRKHQQGRKLFVCSQVVWYADWLYRTLADAQSFHLSLCILQQQVCATHSWQFVCIVEDYPTAKALVSVHTVGLPRAQNNRGILFFA